MVFKQTAWQFSDEEKKDTEFKLPEEGDRYVIIDDATYDEETHQYRIWMTDIGNDAKFRVKYNVDKLSKDTGNYEPNLTARGVLVTLNQAIFGAEKGIPYPEDIKGAVAQAEVKHSKFKGDDGVERTYVNIWKYKPVEYDIVLSYGSIEQYYIGYVSDEEE